jgi:hypothetical protein
MTRGKVPHWGEYLAAPAARRFEASVGLLGEQIASHGGCLQGVGPGAALGAARATGIVDPRDETPRSTRARQVAPVDALQHGFMACRPRRTEVIERLCLIGVAGPHFGAGTLESGSTRQPGAVQSKDLTPTILQHLGIPPPPSLGGAKPRFVPADKFSGQSVDERRQARLDDDQVWCTVHSLVEPFLYGWSCSSWRCI